VRKVKSTYILLIIVALVSACRLTKNVPDGSHLIKKNKLVVLEGELDEEDLTDIIRQKENFKTLGMRLKLRAYNLIDSAHVAEKRIRKNEAIDKKNDRKRARQKQKNERRIEKAQAKGDSLYTRKTIPLKDTLSPRLFLTEFLKYKYGEAPIIFDSIYFEKTIEQHANYLKKKGYYSCRNSGEVKFKKHKKVVVTYSLSAGPRYFIDSVYIVTTNEALIRSYDRYLEKRKIDALVGKPFDRDLLEDYRSELAKEFRDNAFYGFSPSQINYFVDTNSRSMKVTIGIQFSDRKVIDQSDPDKILTIPHKTTYIRNVYFHISDTSLFKGSFSDSLRELGLNRYDGQYLQNIDTLDYKIYDKKKNNEEISYRSATFLFNGELFVDPTVIESQNYLEQTNYYKEYYIDRTYSRLNQLGLFQSIKPVLIEIQGTDFIDVHYYLVPSKKQSYSFQPRATNSNGFLGVSASLNYANKNLFGGAQKMTIALTGGFESQPPVFDPNLKDELIQQSNRSFNTLELGPSIVFDIPGLFPTKLTTLSKRHRPRTIISAAYNFQKREEYQRSTFQANYLWKMFVSKTQIFQYGLPGLSVIKYVNITKSPVFEAQINKFNDLFLRNAYSDQLIWQDFKFVFEYNNKDRDDKKSNLLLYFNGSFDPAGNFISIFQQIQDTSEFGRFQIFGVPYSRFMRFDNDIIMSYPLTKKTSLHLRALGGVGIPTGNKETSLPFDYSFFSGGSNDNRGWRARSLGPGGYKYLLDTNRTLTQIGDIRIGGSAEYRFSLGPTLKMAVFMDAVNIWTIKEDINRPGSQFSNSWTKEIAYSAGVGFRFDLDFFIVRLDLGIPLNNHTLPKGSEWLWNSREAFDNELIATFGADEVKRLRSQNKIPNPFSPQIHFGIGYPF
jgi:outer membrane protein insertion porin family